MTLQIYHFIFDNIRQRGKPGNTDPIDKTSMAHTVELKKIYLTCGFRIKPTHQMFLYLVEGKLSEHTDNQII